MAVAQDLSDQGYTIIEAGGTLLLSTTLEPTTNEHTDDWDRAASDPFRRRFRHALGKQIPADHPPQSLLMTSASGRAFQRSYVPGDLSEGIYSRRPSHIHERFLHSADEQEQYIMITGPRRKGTGLLLSGQP